MYDLISFHLNILKNCQIFFSPRLKLKNIIKIKELTYATYAATKKLHLTMQFSRKVAIVYCNILKCAAIKSMS